MKPITILLADDHAILRAGLRALLTLESDLEIVGEAANGHQAVAFACSLVPDVVVLDLSMPLLNGLDALTRIRACTPASTKILVLSSYGEDSYVQQARALGASGYLVKQSDSHSLAAAIREVYRGNTYFKPIHPAILQHP